MSNERNKRGGSTALNASKAKADGQSFAVRFLKATSELKSLAEESEGLRDYGALVDASASLKKEIAEKDTIIQDKAREIEQVQTQKDGEIARLNQELRDTKAFQDRLSKEYQTKFREWDKDKEQHAIDVARIGRLEGQLISSQQSAEKATSAVDEMRLELDEKAAQLGKCQNELSESKDRGKQERLTSRMKQRELDKCKRNLAELHEDIGFFPFNEEEA